MERSKILTEKISDYKNAIDSFSIAIDLDLSKYGNVELDLLKNGQIQKFEYALELCWKVLKLFLNEIHGIESVSPKSAIKEFFGIGMIDEAEYELLIQMIDDRNRLSHIYNELFFEEIYSRLNNYLAILVKVYQKVY